MTQNNPCKLLLNLAMSLGALMLLTWYMGGWYIDLMLPAYQKIISWGIPEGFRIVELKQNGGSRGQFIQLKLETSRIIPIYDQMIPTGTELVSSTLRGHAFQTPLIALSLLIAWPNINIGYRLFLFAITLPVIILASILDIPMVLLGATIDYILYLHQPSVEPTHFFISWMTFMNDGGRIALGLVIPVIMILLFNPEKHSCITIANVKLWLPKD